MGLDVSALAKNLAESVKSLVNGAVSAMSRDAAEECPLDPALELDNDVRTVITGAMEHARGFSPKVIAGWALGGFLALSVVTSAFAGGSPATPSSAPEPPSPAPVAQAAPEPGEEPQASAVKVAVVVPDQWPMEDAEAASVMVEVVGTADDGEEVAQSVSVVPGSSRTLILEPGAYSVAAKTSEVTLADMVFVASGQTLTVDGSGDDLSATVTFVLDEAKTQEIADAKAEAQRAAEEEAARQAEAERQAAEEAERQAAEAEAARQAEVAAAEAQRNEQTVYVTNTGKKYHKAGCSYLKQSSNPIALNDAIARGYTPCSRCY